MGSNPDVVLNGGTLQLKGHQTEATLEALGRVAFSRMSTIKAERESGAHTEINISHYDRVNGGVLRIEGDGTVRIAGLNNTATGILAPYIISHQEWTTIEADGAIRPFNDYVTFESDSGHVKIQSSTNLDHRGTINWDSINLQMDHQPTSVVSLHGTQLNLTTGGILTDGDHPVDIEGGSISSVEGQLLFINTNHVTLSSIIAETIAESTFTKAGQGTLSLTGNNLHTGSTRVADGELIVSSDANLGKGAAVELWAAILKLKATFPLRKGL